MAAAFPHALRPCVVPGSFELPTSTLSVWRSNQLSYRTGQAAARDGPATGIPRMISKEDRRGTRAGHGKAARASLCFRSCAPRQGALLKRPPERRCSSRTFRYGYLVTT